jgi:hypothetical protein
MAALDRVSAMNQSAAIIIAGALIAAALALPNRWTIAIIIPATAPTAIAAFGIAQPWRRGDEEYF